jgi:hypothetical protein
MRTIDTDTDNIGRVIFEQANDGNASGTFEMIVPSDIGPNAPPEDAPKLVRLTFDERGEEPAAPRSPEISN